MYATKIPKTTTKKKNNPTQHQPIEANSQNLIYDMRIRECAYVSKFKLLFYRIER